MPLILYCIPPSPAVRSVDLIIHALGLPVEYKIVKLQDNEQFKPEFLKMNPLHTVPVIDDDGFILWESRAIMTYLVDKYGKNDALYPKDLKKRAIVNQRLHYSNDVFNAGVQITRPLFFFNKKPTEDQLNRVKEQQENLEKLLDGNQFIAGDTLTVADYSLITLMDILEELSPAGDKYPLTKAWVNRCKSTIKDFDKVNEDGARRFIALVKEKMG